MDRKLSRLTTEQRYDLVAYVDGELDDSDTTRVEKLLAENAVARGDVETLIATYELLRELPRPRAAGDFTEKTIATARLKEIRPDPVQSPLYRFVQQKIGYLGWVLALIAAGLIGYSITRFYVPQPHDVLVQDLDVVEHLDRLTEVGDYEFLERLANDAALMREIRNEGAP